MDARGPTPRRPARVCALTIATVLGVGGLTGCASGSSPRAKSRSRDEIFLASGPNRLRALRLTIDSQHVEGTLTSEDILPSDPTHEQAREVRLGGSERNGRLSLQPVGASGRWTGEVTGDTLVLRYRLADGAPATDTLVRASRSDFERAIGAFSRQVVAADQAARAAERRAREQALADVGQGAAAARLRRQAEAQARAASGRASSAAAAAGRASAAAAAAGRVAAAAARASAAIAAAGRASAAAAAAHRATKKGK